ncbi:MAG: hypothetical protein K2K21_04700 [Lachnospiraceae bacterium]|nr:hypothetical protein [Lachnospiraceae bacterium]
MKIHVNLKSISKRKASVKPVTIEIKGRPATLREFILAVVETGVDDYNQRAENTDLLSCLTKEEISEKAQAGKVGFGINYGESKASLTAAQENAIQCFEDGVYRIFQDDEPLEALDAPVSITEEDVFTFVRLTMLAGRMW